MRLWIVEGRKIGDRTSRWAWCATADRKDIAEKCRAPLGFEVRVRAYVPERPAKRKPAKRKAAG